MTQARLTSPGDRVCICWPLEKEQTLCAVIERYGDGYQRALTWGKYSTRRTEDNVPRDIRECSPIQITLIA